MTVRIDLLPAAHGDCLWVEWPGEGTTHRMLIDGGPPHTYPHLLARLDRLHPDDRTFELLIITHIDADHIDGVVRLLQDAEHLGVRFRRVWFNGREQLDRLPAAIDDGLGVAAGEYVQLLLHDMEDRDGPVWNTCFDDRDRIVYCDPATDDFPKAVLPGGLTLTVVSPDLERLHALEAHWRAEVAAERIQIGEPDVLRTQLGAASWLRPLSDELGGDSEHDELDDALDDGLGDHGGVGADRFPFDPLEPRGDDHEVPLDDELGGGAGDDLAFGGDPSKANGSSIAVLAEWEHGPTVLFAGDAYAGVLQASIEALLGTRSRLDLDAFKLPHHASVSNLTAELLDLLRCRAYLVSTNGVQFGHPHERAIRLILEHHSHRATPRIVFNHRSETTTRYELGDLDGRRFHPIYPEGATLSL